MKSTFIGSILLISNGALAVECGTLDLLRGVSYRINQYAPACRIELATHKSAKHNACQIISENSQKYQVFSGHIKDSLTPGEKNLSAKALYEKCNLSANDAAEYIQATRELEKTTKAMNELLRYRGR